MNDLNSVLLEGNLTKDPESGTTATDISYCNFSIGVNRYYKQNEEQQHEVSFFEITTYGRVAQACADYLKKGQKVRIVGRLKQDRWEGAEGKEVHRVHVITETVEFGPGKKENKEPNAVTAE